MYHLDAKKIAPFSYEQTDKQTNVVVQRYISVKIKVREKREDTEKSESFYHHVDVHAPVVGP